MMDDKKIDIKISKVKKHYRVHTKKAEDFFDNISKLSFNLNSNIYSEESIPLQALISRLIEANAMSLKNKDK